MGNLGGGEILVIVLLALIVLGPDKLPDALRKVGRVVGELRRMSSGFQTELRDALGEPMGAVQDTVASARSMMNPTTFLTGLSSTATAVPSAVPVSDEDGEDIGGPDEPSEDVDDAAATAQPVGLWFGSAAPAGVVRPVPASVVQQVAAVDPFGAPVTVAPASAAVAVQVEDSFGPVGAVLPSGPPAASAPEPPANGSDH